ncbi:MAG: YchJ family protein [Desulfovibrio sp.]
MQCPCGSAKEYTECCEPIIKGSVKAPTAEAVMRSRYSAFTQMELDWLSESLLPALREKQDKEGVKSWAESAEWLGLEIHSANTDQDTDTEGFVEFTCTFKMDGVTETHREIAHFLKADDSWYYVDGKMVAGPPVKKGPKVGRNEPCPCGSGKKFKKCCG